jgi:4-hydroxy-tetrahydrodipicolinate synthase
MDQSGAVDHKALAELVDWHVQSGTSAIVAVGTSGESATLEMSEHISVVEFTVRQVAGRIPIIAGTGANSTREAIELTRAAAGVGATACLLVTPYYNKPTQEGLYRHHLAVAEAVDIEQILYNVPGRTACDMLPDTVVRLAEVPNIVGIKEATGDVDRARELISRTGDDFAIYSGDDATARELMLAGGQGNISVTANIAPAKMAAMCRAALAGDVAGAADVDRGLASLHQRLFLEANPIPVKWALEQMGRIGAGIRLPLTPLAEQYHQPVREAMVEAGILEISA